MGVHGFPRRLVLRTHSPLSVTNPEHLSVVDRTGRGVIFSQRLDTLRAGKSSVVYLALQVEASRSDSLVISYRLPASHREGDEHTGFAGISTRYMDDQFAFVTGRQLFLVPETRNQMLSTVRFTLPNNWGVVTPWARTPTGSLPAGRLSVNREALLSATLGLGCFVEHDFSVGRTCFRIAVESHVPSVDQAATVSLVARVAAYVNRIFGDHLGSEYLMVEVPKTAFGDEIRLDSWSDGQGGTLYPLTPERAHRMASALVAAHTRYVPHRLELANPNEFWLVDGLEQLYGWRALAEAQIVDATQVLNDLSTSYSRFVELSDFDRRLETAYDRVSLPSEPVRTVLAPLALAFLDQRMSAISRGRDSLDCEINKLYGARLNRSFWSSLPSRERQDLATFRSEYLRKGRLLPSRDSIESTSPRPQIPTGPSTRRLTIAFTGKTDGYLENCGCKVNQAGGVGRRATAFAKLRHSEPRLILLDAGSTFTRARSSADTSYLTREEQVVYLRAMASMGYQAVALGETELMQGDSYLRNVIARAPTPFVASNVEFDGPVPFRRWRSLRVHGLSIAVLGILEQPSLTDHQDLLEEGLHALRLLDPVKSLRQVIQGLHPHPDVIVVLGNIKPMSIRRLVHELPDIDVVISTSDELPLGVRKTPTILVNGSETKQDLGGFLGNTLVAYSSISRYGFTTLEVGVDSLGRITDTNTLYHYLYENIPDRPDIRQMLDIFYDRIGRTEKAQYSVSPLQDPDFGAAAGYVGASACAKCHSSEFNQWLGTPHSSAFKTLLDRHRNYQPRCVVCHVVGYGTPDGYRIGSTGEHLANVQCEACHGPGVRHVTAPSNGNIRRRVPEAVCLMCHTPDHSDRFVYGERIPFVAHNGRSGPRSGAATRVNGVDTH